MTASPLHRRLLAATFVSVTLAAPLLPAAQAQTPPAPPTPPSPQARPPMPPDHPRFGMHGGRMTAELDRLKASLKLDANQTALWDRARAAMTPPADAHDRMKAHRDRIAAMLDDPNFDPRKLAAEMDSAQADRAAKAKTMRDAWIAVYDSLNAGQRGQVREFLRSRMTRGPHGHGGMGWHRPDGPPRPDGQKM